MTESALECDKAELEHSHHFTCIQLTPPQTWPARALYGTTRVAM